MGMTAILVIRPALYVNKIFISMYLKAYIQNLVKNGPVVSEKNKFEFSYANDLGPRARNDLVLHCTHITSFIQLVICIHQLSGDTGFNNF